MIFPYHCYECGIDNDLTGKPFHPPMAPQCPECYSLMDRVYGCVIDTSGCKDHDEVAPEHRISVSQEKNISSRQTAGWNDPTPRRSPRLGVTSPMGATEEHGG